MDSDDSDAQEIASDDDERMRTGGDDSDVASEIDDNSGPTPPPNQRAPPPATAATVKAMPPPVDDDDDDGDDAYDDDDYENDDDGEGYSVDFEDDLPPPAPSTVHSPARSPTRNSSRIAAIDEDTEYYEASFENDDESRKSMSVKGSPSRLAAVKSNVPLAAAQSPTAVRQTSPLPVPIPPPAQYWILPPPPPSREPVNANEEKAFALLLRKVESKFADEVETLREQNALLQWQEREAKLALRAFRDDKKRQKVRFATKRKRALARRYEHDRLVESLQSQLIEAASNSDRLLATVAARDATIDSLQQALAALDAAKRDVEMRNVTLAEKLQAMLSDFHGLNLRFEAAISAQLAADTRAADAIARHSIEMQVLEHKCRLECDALQRALETEVAARVAERTTLPETHRRVLATEKERFAQLEAAITKQLRDMEAHTARETARLERAAASALELQRLAEDKAEKRVQTELQAIAREREAIDTQRRELLVSATRSSARMDDERLKLDGLRMQLDARAMALVEERAALDVKSAALADRLAQLETETETLERRKRELTALGRETFDKSRTLANASQHVATLTHELETLRTAHAALQERVAASDERASAIESERARLDKAVLQLQRERLLVAKQRAQSRQFLDGARRLEGMLHQQQALQSDGHFHLKSNFHKSNLGTSNQTRQ